MKKEKLISELRNATDNGTLIWERPINTKSVYQSNIDGFTLNFYTDDIAVSELRLVVRDKRNQLLSIKGRELLPLDLIISYQQNKLEEETASLLLNILKSL